MNITRIVFNTKMLSIIFALVACAVLMRFTLTPTKIIVFCDHRLPRDMQAAIRQKIEATPVRTVGAEGLLKELQIEYPCIGDISISYKGSMTAHVTVKARIPWVCLVSRVPGHKEYIVCKHDTSTRTSLINEKVSKQNHKVAPVSVDIQNQQNTAPVVLEKKYFNELVTQGMPMIVVEGNDFMRQIADVNLIRCALGLRRSLFVDYAITWISKVEILLQSRVSNSILMADSVTVHDKERFAYVDRIVKSDAVRYKNGIKADIRLRDEIICSSL